MEANNNVGFSIEDARKLFEQEMKQSNEAELKECCKQLHDFYNNLIAGGFSKSEGMAILMHTIDTALGIAKK